MNLILLLNLPRTALGFFLLFAVATCLWSQEGEGYRLEADRVAVVSAEHWAAWDAEEGVRVIDVDGGVRPRLLRRDINAVLDAHQFIYRSEGDTLQGGIRQAGSDVEGAQLLLDGDPTTYWEPVVDDGGERGFVEIDLGRAVVARRVDLRFVDEELGDPFLKFRVLVSDGRATATATRRREFFRIGLVTDPNKERRSFSFEVEPQRPVAAGVEGEVVQFVRIEVLGTDGGRGRQIDAEVFAALPEEERGVTDYFRQTVAGRLIRVDADIYAALPASEQGPIRHYRRERPRLAEVGVLSLGDDAVRLTRKERGIGTLVDPERRLLRHSDGRYDTATPLRVYNSVRNENQLEIDLGAKYWIDRLRLLSAEEPLPAYQVRLSDGEIDPNGRRVWRRFDERQNAETFLQLEERFTPRPTRYIEVRRIDVAGGRLLAGNVGEIQAYGEGYVPEVAMASQLIRLNRPRLFSTVAWKGDIPPGTRVELRTRSGNQIERIEHYYGTSGAEITRVAWERIREERRPPVVIEERPGDDWSNWSAVYLKSGERFKSPSPRRYVLAELKLLSDEPLRAARLDELEFSFEAPLVNEVWAEVWPRAGVEPGSRSRFTVYLRPVFGTGNPGFDQLMLRSSSSAALELVEVRAGSEEQLRRGGAELLWPGVLELGSDDGIDLAFPEPVRFGSRIFALTFATEVFLSNTLFEVELALGSLPAVRQQATAGQASEAVESQSLAVLADLRDLPLIGQVVVEPPVFSPNGDGVNDQVRIAVEVFVIEGDKGLEAEVYDLAGRRVRRLDLGRRLSGRQQFAWDGRDTSGRLVPPGLYLLRLGVETDAARTAIRVKPLHVVY
jgi:hypothetical protein